MAELAGMVRHVSRDCSSSWNNLVNKLISSFLVLFICIWNKLKCICISDLVFHLLLADATDQVMHKIEHNFGSSIMEIKSEARRNQGYSNLSHLSCSFLLTCVHEASLRSWLPRWILITNAIHKLSYNKQMLESKWTYRRKKGQQTP